MSSVAAIITTAKDIPSTDFFNTHGRFHALSCKVDFERNGRDFSPTGYSSRSSVKYKEYVPKSPPPNTA
jgi:hypothetical protein